MRLFFITFFTIYGLVHLHAFLKTRAGLNLGSKTAVPVALFMVLMTFAPAIVRYLEDYGHELMARTLSYAGYLWMGLIFLFFSFSLCIDLVRVAIRIVTALTSTEFSSLVLSSAQAFFIPLVLAAAAAGYGYFEAQNIRTEHFTITSSKIPGEISGLRIVQISDVHLGLIVREKRLKNLIKHVKNADPDILISTGDLVDGQINKLEGLAEMLREVTPPHGKFAITGNHEYYAGLDQALSFTERAGFTILRGEAVEAGGIQFVGVDDMTAVRYGDHGSAQENRLLAGIDRSMFTVLLKHRPLVNEGSAGLFDLQISGHTHKGQIFPFNLITKHYYPKHAGHLMLPDGSHLYVSRGTGTWGPPIRFFSPPEITVIELRRR